MVWRGNNNHHNSNESSSTEYGNNGGKAYVNYNRSTTARGTDHRDNSSTSYSRPKGEGYNNNTTYGEANGGDKTREFSSSYSRPARPAEVGAWGKRAAPANKEEPVKEKEKEKAPHPISSTTNAWRSGTASTVSKIVAGSSSVDATTAATTAATSTTTVPTPKAAVSSDAKPAATGDVWSRASKAVKQGSE